MKDRDAFKQGRKDAKDINVRLPRIVGGKVDSPEVEEELRTRGASMEWGLVRIDCLPTSPS